ncbi:MAG: DUF547 domain-containing protein, partial [Pricia sp.]
MNTSQIKYIAATFYAFLMIFNLHAQEKTQEIHDFNALSEQFLINIINEQSTSEIRAQLYGTTFEKLEAGLKTDDEKLAFWINIY